MKRSDFLFCYFPVLLFGTITSILSILELYSFFDAYDFGNYVQAMFNIIHTGFPSYNSESLKFLSSNSIWTSFLSLHFMPFLYVLAPFYFLFPSPITLLIIEDFAIAFAAIPIYLFIRHREKPIIAFVFVLSYLLNPLIIITALNNFHIETFLIPSLTWVLYFGEERRWKWFLLSSLISFSIIEEAGILVSVICLYLLIVNYRKAFYRPFVLLFFIGGIEYFFVATSIATHLAGGVASPLDSAWLYLGTGSLFSFPLAIVLHPNAILSSLQYFWLLKILWFILAFGTTAFLSVLSSSVILAFPWLVVSMLSTYIGFFSPYNFYVSFIAFAIFLPAAKFYVTHRSIRKPLSVFLIGFLVITALQTPFFIAPPSPQFHEVSVLSDFNNSYPNSSVLTVSSLVPLLANRHIVFQPLITPYLNTSIQVTQDIRLLRSYNTTFIVLFVGTLDKNNLEETRLILSTKVCNSSYYGLVFYDGSIVIYRYNTPDTSPTTTLSLCERFSVLPRH